MNREAHIEKMSKQLAVMKASMPVKVVDLEEDEKMPDKVHFQNCVL